MMIAAVSPGGTCGTKPCWKSTGSTGFRFQNKAATPEGVTSVKLRAGADGKAQVQVGGAGALLPLPALGFTLPVTIQWMVQDGGSTECWQTTFSDAATNTTSRFSAAGP